MAVQTCTVSFRDPSGLEHSVEVTAESLYEAAVLALDAFRAAQLMEVAPGQATRLAVSVRMPSTTHQVSIGKLCDWVGTSGKSPREQALKVRLRGLLSPFLPG